MQPITVSTSDASVDIQYSSLVRSDSWASPVSAIQVDVTGTATFTVETSMDDPNAPVNPVPVGSMTWVNALDTNLVNKSVSSSGVLNATPTFIRLKQTAGNGSCTMTFVQFGNATY